MIITPYYSRKIKVLNLVLIMMVLYIHGYYLEAENGFPVALVIQRFFSGNGLCCVANPLFFLVSGMLFYRDVETVKDCFPKIKRRIVSLLVPYLIWNCVFVLWYAVLQNIPGISPMVNGDELGKLFCGDIWIGLRHLLWEPANFPLWFLRDLLIMAFVSPVLYYVIKYLRGFAPLLFLIISKFVNLHISPFFLIGGLLTMNNYLDVIQQNTPGWMKWFCAMIYLGSSIAFASGFNGLNNSVMCTFVICLCGILTIWSIYDWMESKRIMNNLPLLGSLLGYSFFIFLFHEPAYNVIKKIGLKLFGLHDWSLISLYLVNPWIMCAIAVSLAKLLKKYLPNTYLVLVGGR